MFGDLIKFGTAPAELVLRSVVIYLALLIGLRLFGKREIGQFTIYDLVLVLLVANAVQPAVTGPDSSLTGGLLIVATLVLLNFLVSRLDRIAFVHRLLEPEPTIIIHDGRYLQARMAREGVDRDECEAAIREHGMADVSEVRLGVLEPDGTISIVPSESKTLRTRRRVRFMKR
ncbi:MAG TPA: YetF domain-containing protein [Candidatus Dormibacteraeota bacterium]